MNIIEAIEIQTQLGEEITVEGYIVVTQYFSYLVGSLEKEDRNEKQPSILLPFPSIHEKLCDELPIAVGGLIGFQERCTISGPVAHTRMAAFELMMTCVKTLTITPSEGENVVLSEIAVKS